MNDDARKTCWYCPWCILEYRSKYTNTWWCNYGLLHVSETMIFLHLLIVCVTYMITTIHTNPGFTITHIIAISPTK